MTEDYLVQLLRSYWFAPPVALWRAIELRAASEAFRSSGRPRLDLGCGDGLIGQTLFPGPGEIDVGLDPWKDQLRQAAASGVYCHVDRGDGQALPYREGSFATVFSNSVLEHIADPEPVLQEVGRVLQPEGRFIFTVPSDAFQRMLDGYARRMAMGDSMGAKTYAAKIDDQLEHHHYHTPGEWRDLLFRSGLRLLSFDYYMPEQVERFWDRMNRRYGIGQRWSMWNLLVSPRLRALGHQRLLQELVVKKLSRRWRAYYEMDVRSGDKGGGLLLVAQR